MITNTLSIESLYQNKLIPDWMYYQLNGKSAEENYTMIKFKRFIQRMDNNINYEEDEDDSLDLSITSEVKVK